MARHRVASQTSSTSLNGTATMRPMKTRIKSTTTTILPKKQLVLKIKKILSNPKDASGDVNQSRKKAPTTLPPLIWTPPRNSPQQLQHASAFLLQGGDNIMVTAANRRVVMDEVTHGYHFGTADSEMHCEDCEDLPHGVGLAMSTICGSAFFVAYLLIVTLIWQKCPRISKPPDSRLIDIEKARQPFKNPLMALARQAAGGFGVPVPQVKVETDDDQGIDPTAAEILNFWTKISSRGNPVGKSSVTSNDAQSFVQRPSEQSQLKIEEEELLYASLLRESTSSAIEDRLESMNPLQQQLVQALKAFSDNCTSANQQPPASREPTLEQEVVPPLVHSQSTSICQSSGWVFSPVVSSTLPSTERQQCELTAAEEGHRTRPVQTGSPMLRQQPGLHFTRRRKAKLTRQSSLSNLSPHLQPKSVVSNSNKTLQQLQLDSPDLNRTIATPVVNQQSSSISMSTSGQQSLSINNSNEIADFLMLMPRSATLPANFITTGPQRVAFHGARTGSKDQTGSPRPPALRLIESASLLTTEESGVFMMEPNNSCNGDEIWTSNLSKCHHLNAAAEFPYQQQVMTTPKSQHHRRIERKRDKSLSNRADFYSNSKFLFMNE